MRIAAQNPVTSASANELSLAIDKMLESDAFKGSGRAGTLLKFLVERTLAGEPLKELTVGAEALGRGPKFDPRFDSIVRVEVSRLRSRLALYYATEGAADPIRIVVPKGSYAPVVERREPRRRSRWLGAGAIAAVMALGGTVIFWWARTVVPLEASPATRFELDLGESAVLRSTQVGSSSVAISPDGLELVFVSFRGSTPRLMTKRLDELDDSAPRELAGTEGARGPFFSPDGRWVGFAAAGKLWKMQLTGGEPIALCDAHELLGASWGDDGFIVAALSPAGLVRIPSAGGSPEPIAGIAAGARWPHVLPGSAAILYTTGRPGPGAVRVEVYSAKRGTARPLLPGGSYARYLASGHLAWVERAELLVAPFNLDELELTGGTQPLVGDVAERMYGSAELDVSQTGTLVYRRSQRGGNSVVDWVGSDGDLAGMTHFLTEPAEYFGPRLSPDGSRLASRLGSPDRSSQAIIRIADVRTGAVEPLVAEGIESAPIWTPDGRFIIGTGSGGELRFVNANGSAGSGTLLAANGARRIPWSIDAAGERLAFYERGATDGPVTFDLWTVPIAIGADTISAGRPEPLVVSDYFEVYPSLSPDGRWAAYTSLESGAYEVYVREVADDARKVRVSDRGGIAAVWSRDGRRLFYQSMDQRLMVVDLREVDAGLQPSEPRAFSEVGLADNGITPSFDVAPDGRVVVLVAPFATEPEQRATNVTIVIDVFAALP